MEGIFENFLCEAMTAYDVGSQRCTPGHRWAIGYTDRFLIHYIISGKGTFESRGRKYTLHKGNAFLITGEKGGAYEADMIDPWHYVWINISGEMAVKFLKNAGLSEKNPIFESIAPDKLNRFAENLIQKRHENSFIVSGALYGFMGEMIKTSKNRTEIDRKNPEDYINICRNYIIVNSHKKITVNDLSAFIGLDRTYLYRLFKKELDMSPNEFIIGYKIKRAEDLLLTTHLSVKEIANSIGYDDSLAFSKLFSKRNGISPTKFRASKNRSS